MGKNQKFKKRRKLEKLLSELNEPNKLEKLFNEFKKEELVEHWLSLKADIMQFAGPLLYDCLKAIGISSFKYLSPKYENTYDFFSAYHFIKWLSSTESVVFPIPPGFEVSLKQETLKKVRGIFTLSSYLDDVDFFFEEVILCAFERPIDNYQGSQLALLWMDFNKHFSTNKIKNDNTVIMFPAKQKETKNTNDLWINIHGFNFDTSVTNVGGLLTLSGINGVINFNTFNENKEMEQLVQLAIGVIYERINMTMRRIAQS